MFILATVPATAVKKERETISGHISKKENRKNLTTVTGVKKWFIIKSVSHKRALSIKINVNIKKATT